MQDGSILWVTLAAPGLLFTAGLTPSRQADAHPRRMAQAALLAAALALLVALLTAVVVAVGGPQVTGTLGHGGGGLGLYVDSLTAVMFVLVAFVGVVVLRYSRNYLAGDPGQGRFHKWLSWTLASVLLQILAGNLAQLIAAGVATSIGLVELLTFYRDRPLAHLAAKKKFIASRAGDLCLVAAAALSARSLGTLELAPIFERAPALARAGLPPEIDGAAVLLALAALLKSAQLPLHGWLLEVMETPTPVSALLHAGVINAGGFLVLRMMPLIAPSTPAMEVLVVTGGVTALLGSLVGPTQTSVKVALAWSTIAQMGFMMLECGVGAFSAALLHLVAHSLYKAHAFLSAGTVVGSARSAGAGRASRPARLALALAGATAVALAAAGTLGASTLEGFGPRVLAVVLWMALVRLFAAALAESPSGGLLARAAAAALGLTGAWLGLHAVAERLLAASVPASTAVPGPIGQGVVALLLLAFGTVTVLQCTWERPASASPRWTALYVHLANGLYLNTALNRLILRAWPHRLAPTPGHLAPKGARR